MTTEPTTVPQPTSHKNRWIWLPIGLLLIGILALGAVFRFDGLNWSEGEALHPDENFLSQVTSAIQPPKDLVEYFNSARSPLNPYNQNFGLFVYGDLPIFITRYAADILDNACLANPQLCVMRGGHAVMLSSYNGIQLLGRALSAFFDLLALVFMFFIGKRLYGVWTGLLAAALGAATVLQIQQAHFYTADSVATFFVVAAMFFIIRLGDTFSWVDTIAAAVASGLAVSSRINVAPIVGILAVALFVPVFSRGRDSDRTASIESAIGRLVLAGLITLITVRIFMPYAFDGPLSFDERWTSNMTYIRTLMSGENPGGPPGIQWAARTPFVFPWVNIVVWGLGVPLGLAAWFSWAWAAWQTFLTPYLRNRHSSVREWLSGVMASRHLLIWLWVAGYFAWQGAQYVKSMRYELPIYPFLSILAAAGLVAFIDWAFRSRRSPLWRAISIATAAFVIVGAYGWAFAFTEIYRQPTTRLAASRWIYENIPSAVTLNVTQDGAAKPIQLAFPNTTVIGFDTRPIATAFDMKTASTLQTATVNRLIDLAGNPESETVRLAISTTPDGANPIASSDLTAQVEQAGGRGGSFTFNFDPVVLQPGTYFALLSSVSGAPLQAESASIATEAWDEGVPVRVDGHDGYSMYHGVEIQRQNEDNPEKLEQFVAWLDQSDYVTMSSNRAYAPMSRLPRRYPLTSEYYRAMFAGELGFKLIGSFESYPALGPFTFPDQETTQALGLWPDPTRCPAAGVATCRDLINVPLPPAEEAFSVYDHPRVLVFEKTPDFSAEKVRAVLGRVDLSNVLSNVSPQNYGEVAGGLLLPDQTWQAQQESNTWSDLFDRNSLLNQSPVVGGVAWYLTLLLIGWFAFPIVFAAAPGLRDRGYGISRLAGLLIAVFVIWFLASFKVAPFTRPTILLSVLGLGVVGAIAAWRQRTALRAFLQENRNTILIEEALFGATFLFFLFVRFGNPDLWHPVMGGEKPMDFAYLNAVIKSQSFPPYDPWFAGGQITYYYFGFVLIASLVKLVGIVPSIAYNFAIPTLFALTALGAFCVAFNLVQAIERWGRGHDRSYWLKKPAMIGVIAAVFVVFMGNLGEVQQLQAQIALLSPGTFQSTIQPVKQVVETAQGLSKMVFENAKLNYRPEWWYFTPTREIPAPPGEAGPISEFPYFTFLYADLHAHMIALPLTLLVLALAVSWIKRPPLFAWGGIASIGLGGLAAGALRPTNTWDYPTYLVIGAVALAFGTWASEPLGRVSTWLRFGARLIGFVAMGFVAFVPFTRSYATAYSSIEGWQGSLTPWWAYLNIHLLFLFPIVTLIIWEIKRWGWHWWRAVWRTRLKDWRWVVIPVGLVIAGLIFWLYRVNRNVVMADASVVKQQRDVILIAAPIMLACVLLAVRPRLAVAYRFWYFIVFLAVALSAVVEIVVLKGDISRMNTTFKFYIQIWVLLGISAAVALGWLADRLQNWRGWGGWLWKGCLIVLVFASFTYIPLATRGKMLDRWTAEQPPSLNGTDYMSYAQYDDTGQPQYPLKWDQAAIAWLQDNVQGTPVIAEAAGGLMNVPLYHWVSRMSINTGLPTIIGWDWHQRQQRSILPGAAIDQRMQDVATLYSSPDQALAKEILDRYNVKYVVVGNVERTHYAPEGIAKFAAMVANGAMQVAYQNEGTTIYEVVK